MKKHKDLSEDDSWSFSTKVLICFALMLVIFLAGLLYFAYKPSSDVFGNVYYRLPTNEKIVALTFDDGPNGTATTDTLKILQDAQIHATFFVVGVNVEYYPDIAKQIVTDGNEIENHSLYHDRVLPFETQKTIENQLLETNKIIFDATGATPQFFRPPFGFRTPWALDAARKAGFRVVTWNDLTGDYNQISPAAIEKNILLQVHPGAIIVLHDGDEAKHNVNRSQMTTALPVIINSLKSQGYQFVMLNQMIGEPQ